MNVNVMSPSAKKLPTPPSNWIKESMKKSNREDFCKNCENIYYIENEEGKTIQLVHECTCSL